MRGDDAWRVVERKKETYYVLQFASIFAGFLQWDLCWVVWHYDEYNDPSMVIHHLVYLLMTHYNVYFFVFARAFAWLSIAELSTPFLHLRWFFAVLEEKESRRYTISPLLFAVTFLLTRVFGYVVGLWDLWLAFGIWSKNPLGSYILVFAMHVGFVLNFLWSIKVTKALAKAAANIFGKTQIL